MLKHRSKFFLKEYENTSPHYEAMSRGTWALRTWSATGETKW
jgi:hypothetical protein